MGNEKRYSQDAPRMPPKRLSGTLEAVEGCDSIIGEWFMGRHFISKDHGVRIYQSMFPEGMKGEKMITSKKKMLWALIVIALAAFIGSPMAYAQRKGDAHVSAPNDWMDGYTLIVTDAVDINETYAVQNAIERSGGQVGIIIPDRVMLGWVPLEIADDLVGNHKIMGIYHQRLSRAERKLLAAELGLTPDEMDGIRFFNKVVSGKYKPREQVTESPEESNLSPPHMLPDAFEPPPINYDDYLDNLEANGITEETLREAGVPVARNADGMISPSNGNSDYMVGKILFYGIFVESNGAIDPNDYTWTAADKTTIKDEIKAGLSWWVSTAKRTADYNMPLTFVYKFGTGRQGYEPIRHPHSQDYRWINPIMATMGYGVGDKFARTTAFNTANRINYNTNWAVVSFIGYNPSPASTTFTDGWFAYAYRGGPYSQLLYRNNGWGVGNYDRVNAHETGHLFGAVDEYSSSGCSTGRATNNVYNGNCESNPNSIDCIMNHNSFEICGYTPGQLGWRNAQRMKVQVRKTDGSAKTFWAPGEAIHYRIYYCIAGPRIGSMSHDVRVRFRADFFTGTLDSSGYVADDTGWGSAGSIAPPTSTGLACYYSWWNRNVPAGVSYGHATVSAQLEIEGMGRQADVQKGKFYVAPGAETTEPSPPFLSPDDINDEGPFLEPAPLPWELDD